MALIPLDLAKAHLRVDHDEEDTLIQSYIEFAEDYVTRYCDRTEPWAELPGAVQAAALLIIGDLYENREAQSAGVQMYVNRTVEKLLNTYTRLTV